MWWVDFHQPTRGERRRKKKRRAAPATAPAPLLRGYEDLLAVPGAFASRRRRGGGPYDSNFGANVVSRTASRAGRRPWAPPVPAFERALDAALESFRPRYAANGTKRRWDWAALPAALDVGADGGGGLPEDRRARKREQLENVMSYVDALASPGDVVVDFCAGCGHQSLPLAYVRRDVTFVLVDKKARSLAVAARRAASLGLTNVRCVDGLVGDFDEPFDVGIALHACGGATEDVLATCVDARAALVVAPCCVGAVRHWCGTYPRSRALRAAGVSPEAYGDLAKAADTNASTRDAKGEPPTRLARRRLCKSVVEADRLRRCVEAGYDGALVLMDPPTCTPKNDMIVAWPASSSKKPPLLAAAAAAAQPPWIPDSL